MPTQTMKGRRNERWTSHMVTSPLGRQDAVLPYWRAGSVSDRSAVSLRSLTLPARHALLRASRKSLGRFAIIGRRCQGVDNVLSGQADSDQQAEAGPFVIGGRLTVSLQQIAQTADRVEHFQRPAIARSDALEVQTQRTKHWTGRLSSFIEESRARDVQASPPVEHRLLRLDDLSGD